MFTEEEKAVLLVAIGGAISGCQRSAAKAGLPIVKEAYAKQAMVLAAARDKLMRAK